MRPMTRKILFLCTANSCRSQMAEGWMRHLHGDEFEVHSAGIKPSRIHPLAVRVMKEAGVDISAQVSKHLRVVKDVEFDYVVTVCDDARASCPIFPGKTKVLHAGFEDPAAVKGSEEAALAVFRRVRDQIRDYVAGLPASLGRRRFPPR
jgi:arsenate reductase